MAGFGESGREFWGSSQGQQPEGEPFQGHRQVRRRGMPEEERRARQQRRRRMQENQRREKTKDEESEATRSNAQQTTEQSTSTADPGATDAESTQEQKPWESTVIGDLGENLSYIEEKNREIERHRYIVKYHQEHSPHQVDHHQKILDQLIKERLEMEDNEENNLPENQREERNRIGERLDLLTWALDTCQCEAEEANIRAAIEGYQSGEIAYSPNFTLIYAGHIVDVCPTYQSFCVDREERLDLYSTKFGPGWLWHEPPLSDAEPEVLAKKGTCLYRRFNNRNYRIGHYLVTQEFTVDNRKVSRGYMDYRNIMHHGKSPSKPVSCRLQTLLDSGATYPVLPAYDLRYLNVNLRWYAAQGVTRVTGISGAEPYRFFEMYVTVRTEKGETLVGEGDQAVWPDETRIIGGFTPVVINHTLTQKSKGRDRLSGMIPFDACYMSSAPTTYEFWLGEDRRDVLGARRMPPHLRFDAEKVITTDYPESIEKLREGLRTPDQVIFVHQFEGESNRYLSDADASDIRGKSELAIMERKYDESIGRNTTKRISNLVFEPRKGQTLTKDWVPMWRKDYLDREEFLDPNYKEAERKPPDGG